LEGAEAFLFPHKERLIFSINNFGAIKIFSSLQNRFSLEGAETFLFPRKERFPLKSLKYI